jgi:peptidoglycan/LPS O-acetylase OafA/YrhL
MLSAGLLLLCQFTCGYPFRSSQDIKTSTIQKAEGKAYVVSATPFREVLATKSFIRVTENGSAMWHSSASEQVKRGPGGQFAISPKQIWFSSSDGSSVETNDRRYALSYAATLTLWHLTIGWLLTLIGLLTCLSVFAYAPTWKERTRQPSTSVHYWKKPGYEWGLDVMRGLAILLVLLTHLPSSFPAQVSPILHNVFELFKRGGWVGVDLFFVMSGYLVSGLLIQEYERNKEVSVGRFLLRRGWKIYPAHWFMLLVTMIVASYTGIPNISIDKVVGEVFYLQNLLSGNSFGSSSIWLHTWSLAVEEHFYVLIGFAFAIRFAHHRNAPSPDLSFIPWMTLAICAFCLCLRLLRMLFAADFSANLSNYYMSYARLDALMAGVFIRYCRFKNLDGFLRTCRQFRYVGFAICAVAFSAAFTYGQSKMMLSIGLTTNYLGAVAFLLAIVGWQSNASPTWLRPLAFIGRYSYSIYLWHIPLYVWILYPHAPSVPTVSSWLVSSLGYLGLAIAVGYVASCLIESPMLRLRDAVLPTRLGTKTTV